MSKAMVAFDEMPRNCDECLFSAMTLYKKQEEHPSCIYCQKAERFCEANYEDERPDWCPYFEAIAYVMPDGNMISWED